MAIKGIDKQVSGSGGAGEGIAGELEAQANQNMQDEGEAALRANEIKHQKAVMQKFENV